MGKQIDKYILNFHQDILTINESLESAVREATGAFSGDGRVELRHELEEIVSDPSIGFANIWNNSGSPFRLKEDGAREVLEVMLAVLNEDEES